MLSISDFITYILSWFLPSVKDDLYIQSIIEKELLKNENLIL
jgi:hypothetical protein